ncbi:aldose 1-epimerase [Timonella sp. A28]|uniref:aldose 1-epimerase n=1 Tax=Timonella sp. A28 TaxID=3442640 RepID=UPI003EC06747
MNSHSNTLSDGKLGSLPTKILTHGQSGARIEVAIKGATLLSWTAPFREESHAEFISSYNSEEDFESQTGMRSGFLFPFANRLKDNQYTWDGVTYDVPKQTPQDFEVIHGFVRLNDWRFESAELDDPQRASLVFSYAIRENDYEWYPFSVDLAVRFDVSATGLSVSLAYRNVGVVDAPAAGGWHPYFQIPGYETIDSLALKVPSRARIRTDAQLVPLDGESAYEAREGDLIHSQLAGVNYDDAWGRLVPDEDGFIRTTLTDPNTGEGIAVWQQRGTALVFTGGSFPHPRASVAIEPIESLTNAFNREDCESDVRLAPGEERVFHFGVTLLKKS